ncbi:MAG: LytTR family transcriptional regulator [Clostridia bacterium]|nr:LytTR family transcriptional regulator [Clostridia bacterium]
MKLEFRADENARDVRVIVVAKERTPEVEAILARLAEPERIAAYSGRGEVLLEAAEIIRVYTQRRRVLVDSARGTFSLRSRLYEIEERLGGGFVRISNSEIVNRMYILSLDFSLAGTIRLSLKGGIETYVSRRYVSRIKKTFGG